MDDPNASLRTAMHAQIQREMDLAHSPMLPAIHKLMLAMSGFAANATQCGACQMSNQIAREALLRFELATHISVEDAYSAERSRKSIEALKEAP